MRYEYRCPQGHYLMLNRPMDNRDDPVRCRQCEGARASVLRGVVVYMKRIFSKPYIIGSMQKDMPENQLFFGDKQDRIAQQKADDAEYERNTASYDTVSQPQGRSLDSILSSGIYDACKTPDGLAAWRKDNVVDSFEFSPGDD